MSSKPKNIIILIADSLRYDSVFQAQGTGLDYVEKNAVTFTEARSSGCWTLPATAGLFTGMLPHEHGATAQTRGILKDIPTLAEQMKAAGYATYQITANIATTDIFGLERGFDEVRRIWKFVDPKFSMLQQLIVLLGKPRLRNKIISKDFIMRKMSEDLEMAKTWLQNTHHDVMNMARQVLKENEAKGKPTFLFLNLMETHFPYHIAPTFKLSGDGIFGKINEVISLYNLVNQTFIIKGEPNIKPKAFTLLRQRQQKAWQAIANDIDSFCQELHQGTDNLVVFGADHGENFGESGWAYHFSNITDAGNKVPFFWLDNESSTPRTETMTVSTRDLYHTLCQRISAANNGPNLLSSPERSCPILSSYWYNNHGKTHPNYKYNQIAFLHEKQRFLKRNELWYSAPLRTEDGSEPQYIVYPKNVNPLHELVPDNERKKIMLSEHQKFEAFSSKIKF